MEQSVPVGPPKGMARIVLKDLPVRVVSVEYCGLRILNRSAEGSNRQVGRDGSRIDPLVERLSILNPQCSTRTTRSSTMFFNTILVHYHATSSSNESLNIYK
jgi:hypothetical protein